MNFAETLREHLANYKKGYLRVDKHGLWKRNDRPYPHILPEREQNRNILETIHEDFWAWPRRPKLHRDFHHLNSSQAMCFNLFFPFLGMSPDRSAALLEALGIPVEPVSNWDFEKVPDTAEGTNFDLWIELASGRQLFFELKLTEGEFGTAKPNEKRRVKYESVYGPRLRGRVAGALLEPEAVFFQRYQLMRNLWHLDADRGDRLFLVFPRANRKLVDQADDFHSQLEGTWAQHVIALGLETLHQGFLEASKRDGFAQEHLAAFSEKYLP